MKTKTKQKHTTKLQDRRTKGAYTRRYQPFVDINTERAGIPLHVLKRRDK